MLILEAVGLEKYYGDRRIISVDRLEIHSGERIGIVGQNGAGKTTLMDILAGRVSVDEGRVKRYGDVAYIRQFEGSTGSADIRILKEFGVQDKVQIPRVSGGENTRLRAAEAFSSDSGILFADEPTSNLDVKGVEVLKEKLEQVETLVLISHDRELLDEFCSRIIEVKDGSLSLYEGNYSSYRQQKMLETDQEQFEYSQYVNQRVKLEGALIDRKAKAKAVKKTPSRMGNSEARLHKRESTEIQKKINQAANVIKTRIEKLEVKEKPREMSRIKLDFTLTRPPENKIVISAEDLSFHYGSQQIFLHAAFSVLNGTKTALMGDNGSGKTTLLNLIFEKNEQLRVVPKAVLGYFRQDLENLDPNQSVLENVMRDSVQSETSARTILARLLIAGDEVYKKAGVLSGGERIKVSLAKIMVSNANILLLDEPTNYLDIPSIEALTEILADYPGTVLYVSHDRAFVNETADRLLILENGGITGFEGGLAEYDSSRQRSGKDAGEETRQSILQMRITEVLARLSRGDGDREALEEEYNRLLKTRTNSDF